MLVAYLAFAYRLPDSGQATGPLADLYRLGRVATPVGVAAAASVVAYLFGVALVRGTSPLTTVVMRWRRGLPSRLADRLPGTSAEEQIAKAFESVRIDRLADRIRDDADFRVAIVRHGIEIGRANGTLVDEARLDALLRKHAEVRREAVEASLDADWREFGELGGLLPLMVQRMRGQDENAAAEYDRLTTEAEFRTGMAWPLLVLLIVLAVRWSPWWLAALPAVAIILAAGSSASLQATILLKTIIAAGRYDEPVFQQLDSVPAQQLLARRSTSAAWADQAAVVVTALAIDPGRATVAGGTDDGYLVLWNPDTGELLRSWVAHRDQVDAVEFSADGTRLVTLGADGEACVWNPGSGEKERTLDQRRDLSHLVLDRAGGRVIATTYDSLLRWNLSSEEPAQRYAHSNVFIFSVSISPDGTLVARTGDNSVALVQNNRIVPTVKTDNLVACVALDGGQCAYIEADKDQQYRLAHWSGAESIILDVPGEPFPPLAAAESGQIRELIYTTSEGDVMALGVDGDRPPRRCAGHARSISAVAVSSDSTLLVSASYAGTVQLQEFGTGKLLRRLVPTVDPG